MRCAGLAEAWMSGRCGPVSFVGDVNLPAAVRYVSRLGASINKHTEAVPPDAVVVVDHYSDAVRAEMSAVNCALHVLVDDLGGGIGSEFDVIWRPAPSAETNLYPDFQGALLTGVEFLSIRSGLPTWSAAPTSGTAFLLGAARPPQWLSAALSELPAEFDGERFGGVAGLVPDDWEVIDGNDPWPAIAHHRRLVTAAGSTLWEAARVGIPVVVLLIAENQRLNFEWARDQGVPCLDATSYIGQSSLLAQRLLELLPNARRLPTVENGSDRVRDAILDLLDQEV
jgi:hypothetical protein